MRRAVYTPNEDPEGLGSNIVIVVSGEGTNYVRIRKGDSLQNYFVVSNVSGCKGIVRAENEFIDDVRVLDSKTYCRLLGIEKMPRRGPIRDNYDMAMATLIEDGFEGEKPDLICLAGYDLWLGDWFANRYYPRILNIHPGDTTK